MAKVYAFTADGMEEVECLAVCDILRRAGVNLKAHEGLAEMLKAHAAAGKRLAAICAAPSVLGALGLADGHRATCFPGFEGEMKGADCRGDGVVTDRLLTTGRGMGWSLDMGLELTRLLCGEETAAELKKKIQYEK